MDTPSSITYLNLARVTERAMEAAEQGRWDVVDVCYLEREIMLGGADLRPHEAKQLMGIDSQIQERARVAQSAAASLLHDSSTIRQNLKGLRQGLGAMSSDSGMILLKA